MSILQFKPADSGMADKFKGCLLGLQIGDSMGMAVNGWFHHDIKEVYGRLDFFTKGVLRKGDYTDDTEQALCVAQSLCENKGFNGNSIAAGMALRFNKKRGYDLSTTASIAAIKSGFDWTESGVSTFYAKNSYGNTAASRVAPIALLYFNDHDRMIKYAVMSSMITHVDPLAIEGVKLQAHAISHALCYAKHDKRIDPLAFCDYLDAQTDNNSYREKIGIVRKYLTNPPSISRIVSELGCGFEAVNSVPAAIYSFLLNYGDFKESVVFAVNLGGSADAVAAMAGSLSGVYLGAKAIPDDWVKQLRDNGKESCAHGAKLCKLWAYNQSMPSRYKISSRLSKI